jgi:TatD DNase family protein
MTIIDTHSHIYLSEFEADREGMLERAKKGGIVKILMPAIDSASHKDLLALEKSGNGMCLAMMGLHPCSVKENYRDELNVAREYFALRKFIAVGETGLDFYWDKSFVNEQYAAFREQIEWALQYDIPLSIHSRNATEECIGVVAEHQNGKLKGVFHCFSGTAGQAKKIIDLGFYLGIGGVVTFKNSGLDKVLDAVGMENIVLETDAPYLAPVPYRGKRNEPAYIQYVLQKLAAIKNLETAELATITTANAKKLFRC